MGAATPAGSAAPEIELVRLLKEDALGRVELVRHAGVLAVRRRASGGRLPCSARVARMLLAREERALRALAGLNGVARVLERARDGASLVRSYVPGTPLCLASELPRDFFERLEDLVRALHARGVCHNDLHKEANVLVGEDGHPALVDFQLASLHPRGGRRFAVRAREDLRHVWKHRSAYHRALCTDAVLPAAPPRSLLAEGWRRFAKPLVRRLAHSRVLRAELASGEPRRGKHGPWPRWSAPVGPRSAEAQGEPAGPVLAAAKSTEEA